MPIATAGFGRALTGMTHLESQAFYVCTLEAKVRLHNP